MEYIDVGVYGNCRTCTHRELIRPIRVNFPKCSSSFSYGSSLPTIKNFKLAGSPSKQFPF